MKQSIRWRLALRYAGVSAALAAALHAQDSTTAADRKDDIVILDKFVANGSDDDSAGLIGSAPTGSVFGMAKPPTEIPRSLTVISGEMTDQFAITNLADLSRFAPNTDTAFSFGIQGAISIRGDSSDAYFDGMKRLNNAANMPTVFGATDGLVVVKGPPSAIFGNGQVGGYVDFKPKTGSNSATGEYLSAPTGQITAYIGSYDERKMSVEAGGPARLGGRKGGFYIYAQYEDDGSFYIGSFTRMSLVQGSVSLDLTPKIRLLAGFNSQYYRGTGIAGWNRVDQTLITDHVYQAGLPLNSLDSNGDGILSRAELLAAGDLNKTIPDIPDNPNRPALPKGYALNPATMYLTPLDPRRVLIERDAYADDLIGYMDLTDLLNEDWTLTNKLFTEYQHHHKSSDIAYSRAHEAQVAEERLVLEDKPVNTPAFVKLDTVAAVNARWLESYNIGTSGEQIFSRWDLTTNWMNDPASPIIANANEEPALAGPETSLHSQSVELGTGVISDSTWWDKLTIDLGGRADTVYADVFQNRTNTQAPYLRAWAWNHALSHSESVSYALFGFLHPYYTIAREHTIIPGAAGGIGSEAAVHQGVLAASQLQEGGVKWSAFSDRLVGSFDYYDQSRGAFNTTLNQYQFTRGDGYEVEAHWLVMAKVTLSASADWQEVYSVPETPRTNVLVSPEWAGYTNQQALGGLIKVTIPATPYYQAVPGLPHTVENAYVTYQFLRGWSLNANLTHYSQFAASIVHDVTLPAASPVSASLAWSGRHWSVQVSGRNLFNQVYFQSNSATGFGDVLVIPMPTRTWEVRVSERL